MATCLVTGGSGFIGRHLVRALHAGDDQIRVLDVARAPDLPSGVELRQGSVLSPKDLSSAMQGVTCVYHLAGIAHLWAPQKSIYTQLNTGGTVAVIAAAAAAGVKRVVHCSTAAILLPSPTRRTGWVEEDELPEASRMAGPYSLSKLNAEHAVLRAAREGLDVVIVSPTIPIGPGDDNLTPPTAMLNLLLSGRMPAFLNCRLNLVDVRDVASGMMLAARHGRRAERYVLAGENLSFEELLRRVGEASGRPMPWLKVPAPLAVGCATVMEWISDHAGGRTPDASREGVRLALQAADVEGRKARQSLGYRPQPIATALKDALDWLTERREPAATQMALRTGILRRPPAT